MHHNSTYIAAVDVPLIYAVQEANSSLFEARQTAAILMSADGNTGSDEIIKNKGKLRHNIARVDSLLNAIIWGSDSEAFNKSAAGLNKLEWQHLGFDKKLRIEKGSE